MSKSMLQSVNGKETTMFRSENERESVEKYEKIAKEDVKVKKRVQKNYDMVSQNGDTLELSDAGKKLCVSQEADEVSSAGKKVSDAVLSGCSEAKLKQMYAQKKISKQQYEKAMRRIKKR